MFWKVKFEGLWCLPYLYEVFILMLYIIIYGSNEITRWELYVSGIVLKYCNVYIVSRTFNNNVETDYTVCTGISCIN